MEKYQMFFPPCSSSPDMTSSLATCMQPLHNFQGHNPMTTMFNSSSSSDGSGRGFLLHGFVNNSTIDGDKNNNVVVANRAQVNNDKEVFEENSNDKEVVMSKKDGKKKIKKPKFAFQTRSQVDILDDGYRWRKYGQKAVKNNKFPRSYYRCTQQGCSVKKQVQRVADDEGVVVTTYEGMHTHPIHNPTDNFEHILTQMQVYAPF